MSITDLADACEVGDASVYRFCRTMKLQGYQEFKMKLSLSQAASEGFGTEAAKEGTRIGFEELSLHRMEADVMTENRASLRILEKCGYKKEGYFREYFRINGKWEDHIHMAAIRA